MEFSNDIVSRGIKDMVRMAAIIAFGACQDKFKKPKFVENCVGTSLYEQLLHLIDDGKINEAENQMLESINIEEKLDLEMALSVYSYINEKEDSFLEDSGFMREEIVYGIKSVMAMYGYEGLL